MIFSRRRSRGGGGAWIYPDTRVFAVSANRIRLASALSAMSSVGRGSRHLSSLRSLQGRSVHTVAVSLGQTQRHHKGPRDFVPTGTLYRCDDLLPVSCFDDEWTVAWRSISPETLTRLTDVPDMRPPSVVGRTGRCFPLEKHSPVTPLGTIPKGIDRMQKSTA